MDAITTATGFLAEPTYWVALLAVVGLAVIASAIPGMNAFLVMALALPFVVLEIEDPAIGLVALATISGVSNTLDSIPAVLLGQPSAATQVTFLEGHQLARQGKAAHTLGAIYAVSALGGIVGAVILVVAIPVARPFVLKFGFSEIAATGMVGIVMVTVLSRNSIIKGFVAALIGMLFGMIGTDGRFTVFPFVPMPTIPFILGLFALPELVDLTVSRRPVAAAGGTFSSTEVLRGARYGVSRWPMILRQSVIGVFLGAIPGVGSAVVDWLSYAFGIMLTKDKTEFGKGSLDGVLFAESAQNAKEAGAALPTLALGIPGAPTWALVVVAMMAFGVAPGPEMLGTNAHITILLVITLALANLVISGAGLLFTGKLARLTTIPYPIIGSIIIPVMLLSAFIDTTNWRGIQVALGVGAMGLVMKRYGWPRPPMILGFILIPIVETNHLDSAAIYGHVGSLMRPLTATILVIALAVGVLLFRSMLRVDVGATPLPSAKGAMEPVKTRNWARRFARPQVYIPLVAMTGVSILLGDHLQNPIRPEWRWASYSFWVPLVALVLLTVEVVGAVQGRSKQASIMDLGMLSSGVEGARSASYRLVGLFAVFLLVGTTAGLKWGALAFAVGGPLVMLSGRGKWPLALVSGSIVWLFIYVVLDYVLFVIYPKPFLLDWLRGAMGS
jgi:TctA family transporter